MSDSKNLPKSLPDMEHSFEIDVEGNMTKKRFNGTFTYRIPNLNIRAKIDKDRARLNEGLDSTLDESVRDFHAMFSYLRHTLILVPDWYSASQYGYDLYDANVLTTVYRKVTEFEVKWMEEVWGKAPKK